MVRAEVSALKLKNYGQMSNEVLELFWVLIVVDRRSDGSNGFFPADSHDRS